MGAWAHGSFANDDALDWLGALDEDGIAAIRTALQAIADARDDDYVEAPEASSAVAAAEVVAAARGRAASDLPDEITTWVARGAATVTDDDAARARAAVTRIRDNSELRELWDDSASASAWMAAIDDLLARLS